jgi:hypothetical protein
MVDQTSGLENTQMLPGSILAPPSHVGALPLWTQTVDIETSTSKVEEMFLADPSLPACIITSGGRLAGLLSQKRLNFALSRPFGREVLVKRPVSVATDAIDAEPLVLPAQTGVAAALRLAMTRGGELCFEPILVENGNFYGVLEIHVLMNAQAILLEQTLQSKEQLMKDVHNAARELKRFVDQVQRVKELEAENIRLRNAVSDLAVQNAAIRGGVTQPR